MKKIIFFFLLVASSSLLAQTTLSDRNGKAVIVNSPATTTSKGTIKLSGDLTGTADSPTIANGAVTNAKVATGIDKSKVGLNNVDNTSDVNKPVSTATQTAINTASTSDRNRANHTGTQDASTVTTNMTYDKAVSVPPKDIITTIQDFYDDTATKLATKANLASPAFTGTVSGITKSMVGLGNVDNTSDANKPISTATQSSLNTKEPTISAGTTTQYWRGDKSWQTLDKTVVGLGSVDNTSDANKPVSNATQTALNLKANLASPTFTGTVSGVTKAMVGLGSVDNTSDASKPISTATQNALNGKENNISSGTTSQYYRGDKSWQTLDKSAVGLGKVNNITTQTGFAQVGAGSAGVNQVTVTFPVAFASNPTVVAVARNATGSSLDNTYAITIRSISPSSVTFNVLLLYNTASAVGGSWTQNLLLHWMATD